MAVFAGNLHNTPGLASFDEPHKFFYTREALLYIDKGHQGLVKILYFIVSIHTDYISINTNICQYNKRVELESKALDFQSKESRAVLTNTHQRGII